MRSLKDMAVCVAVSDVIIFLFHCAVINLFRVCTGHGKPGKSWNFRISFSWPGRSWNLSVGHVKSLKMMLIKKSTKSLFIEKMVKSTQNVEDFQGNGQI